MRIAVVGCRRGGSFVAGLKAAGFSLAAAMDPDESALHEFGTAHGIRDDARFTHYEALLDCGVEAVVLGSPMPFHAPQAILALNAGIHVLSEVTAAVSIDECLRLRDAARASTAAYMMAENYVYTRTAQTVISMARSGVFGEIYYAEGAYLHDVRSLIALPDGAFTWRKFWQMGRRGLTYPTHSLGPVLTAMDDRLVSLSARGSGIHTDAAYEGDDTAVLIAQTAKGGLVSIRTDLHSRRPHNMDYVQLQGTKGCYEAPRGLGDEHKVYLADRHDTEEWRPLSDFEGEFLPDDWRAHGAAADEADHGGGDFVQFLDFARACQGAPPAIDVYAALDWTLPGLVSERSVEEGGISLEVPDPRTEELDQAAEKERSSGRTERLNAIAFEPE